MATPVIQVRRVVLGELNADPTQFVVWLSEPSATPVTVNWSLLSQTATAGTDFTGAPLSNGTLTFPAGITELTVPFNITNDASIEGTETFKLRLSGASTNALIGDTETTATIVDNDAPTPTPRVSVSDFVIDEETREASFAITLDNAGTQVVTLNYATQNGTALAGSDYVATSGALSFAVGETAKTVKVGLVNDSLAELSERFNLVLSALTGGATTVDAVGTATIHENDATRVANSAITVDDVVVGESETYVDFLVRLNAPNLGTVTVNYQNQNDTARNIDNDYTADTGTLTFAAGEMVKTVRITLGTAFAETNDLGRVENFKLQLLTPSANATIARAVGTATIIDNDIPTPTPRVSVSDFVIDEETREASFAITLDNAGTQVVTLNYATQNGTALAGSDYVATSGALSFAVGETAKTVKVGLINDSLAELSERFNLVLSALTGGATTLDAVGTATIHENDATRVANSTITVDDVVVGESETYVDFLVRLNAPNLGTVTVNYQNQNDTARNIDNDYTADTGTLTFAAGEMVKTVRITLGTAFAETNDLGRVENFKLQLLTPSANATIARAVGTATIIDNDIPTPTPRVSVSDFVIDEETREASFAITLDNAGTQVVTLNYATQNGTALAGSDYVATSGALSFAVGETAKTVKVGLVNDSLAEFSESFNLVLSGLTGGATTLDAVGTATIHGNDATRVANSTITVDDVVVGESETYADFLVRLNAPNLGTVTVNYQNINETARNIDNDYTADTGTLTFAAGEMVKTVRITLGTAFAETNDLGRVENFKLQLLTPSANATIARAEGTATIIDNDTPSPTPVLSIADVVADERDSIVQVTVALNNAGTTAVTVDYAIRGSTATGGADYRPLSAGSVAFAPGETVKTILIGPLSDGITEGPELFDVMLSNAVGATLADANAHVVIAGSNGAVLGNPTITVANVAALEGTGYLDFLVALSSPSTNTVSVNYTTANGTAIAGFTGDYIGSSDTLRFAPGEMVKTVRVALNDDVAAEVPESFSLRLSGAVNAVIGTAAATGTILDNESALPATLALAGTAGPDILRGTPTADTLTGSAGDDVLIGAAGNDTMEGGTGNDTYVVEAAADVVTEAAAAGTDTVLSSISYVLGNNLENLYLTGIAAINGTGNALANVLTGNTANNILNGGAGVDRMIGGLGNDTYIVDNTLDTITELAGGGTDRVQSSANYTLSAELENLTLAGAAAINGTGNALANVLTGNAANNILNGGAGADTLSGGLGNDTYVVDNAGDLVTEAAAAGTDSVLSSISYVLGAELENLTLTGVTAINGTGNALANVLTGNAANNVLNGGAGADLMIGGLGNDTYVVDNAGDLVTELAAAGTDTVQSSISYVLGAELENLTLTGAAAINGTGNALANVLTGNAANNILNGGAGADLMIGGLGNDTYVVDNAGDLVTEAAAAGTDTVQSSISYVLGAELENLTLAGAAAINGSGNTLANVLTGNAANNVLNGGTGADRMIGGLGNDTYIVDNTLDTIIELAGGGTDRVQSSVSFTLGAELENLTLAGTAAINGTGNALANVLTGNAANNILNGGAGADTLSGGLGNDTYVVDNAGDLVTEAAAAGTDTVQSSISYVLGAELENLTLTGVTAINGTGSALANVLTGNAANNILNGGAGADLMIGGLGNDTYVVDNAGDLVTEAAAAGTDTVQSSISYVLGAELENLTLTGAAAINGSGNALANVLTGNTANNVLNGGTGADTLSGGLGNDTYVVDNAGDLVTEAAAAGTDTVLSSINYVLGAELENLNLAGVAAINGTGNALANVLTGNAANNILNGGAGVDRMIGGLGNDTYIVDNTLDTITELAGGGTDRVQSSANYTLSAELENLTLAGAAAINGTGNALANVLTGNAANNVLNGGAGADTLSGGLGNDTYVVDNAGDLVTEAAAAGTDTVQSSIGYVLGAELENLTLAGAAAINGTGNALANVLTGNAANNILNGGAGTDLMIGGLGNDTYVVDNAGDLVTEAAAAGTDTVQSSISYVLGAELENLTLTGAAAINGTGNALANVLTGNAANNILNGGAGADLMIGGLGNDTYVVENAGDLVTEAAAAGTDTVQTSISYVLGAELENLTLAGAAAINGSGNALANVLTGNTANNVLNGGTGADTLSGGLGNDTYVVDNAGDLVTELAAAGTDTVLSSISYVLGAELENLNLAGVAAINGTGNALANVLTGNAANNILNDNVGNDTLAGGAGNDTLTGGAGADIFSFNTALNGTTNVDTLTDFTTGVDHFALSRIIFSTISDPSLAAGDFFQAGPVALDAGDRILYDQTNGALSYDADGTGATAAIQVATVGSTVHPAMAFTDFLLV
ncbi:hypothetical protein B0D71_00830 [Pseudomonas laurylsulfativorans]|uniref:Calx-beta domain-containing protein n=1 Tax=Pseudomonas laurylsulfativorans TaxID=1943631 RepID=A0A2S3VTZ3_9PSED|nr:Calx-beta domain-containing protein [Pseudomonas laurylsulfativorans]POF43391.1 hypothetical protein B0D71_00830 [Pseudomonas laurylsulfativorans]